MKQVRILPVQGRLVRMPDRGYAEVPKDGATVVLDGYYSKAIRLGDVVVVDETTPAKPVPSPVVQAEPEKVQEPVAVGDQSAVEEIRGNRNKWKDRQ